MLYIFFYFFPTIPYIEFKVSSIGVKQNEIEDQYQKLLILGETRRRKLEEACKGYQLLREANDLADWIRSRVSIIN